MAVEVDHSPARVSVGLSLAAGSVAVLTVGLLGTVLPFVIAGVGLVLLAGGVMQRRRGAVSAGAFVLFVGIVVAGGFDAPPEPLLIGTVCVILAWDTGEQAINVGEQLGRAAETHRGEIVHAASTTVVGATATAIGYGIFHFATGGQPLAALFLLSLSAIVLVEALRE